ncbi:hypothetical protein ABB02_01854 [Clostridiaceae bacterium JG1575]|nr:hypothetical protein ABB02_01854 [Clostridiaceae bacterium JG1575]
MKKVCVEEAVGQILAHDVTRILPGKEKGPLFRRGHVIAPEDVPLLLDIGKKNLYITTSEEPEVHEDEAAQRIVSFAAGSGVQASPPSEGKINLSAQIPGVLRIDEDRLIDFLSAGEICFSTATPQLPVAPGDLLAACRIIPLTIEQRHLEQRLQPWIAEPPLLWVEPYQPQKVGLVITGSEVAQGRIPDGFGPLLTQKNEAMGAMVLGRSYPGDDPDAIEGAILAFIESGATLVEITGGMSVDPDDCTPDAITRAATQVVSYGSSVLPGAMFMLAYRNEIPLVGLPGGVAVSPFSMFDFVVPRLFCGERLDASTLSRMAVGGLLAARR